MLGNLFASGRSQAVSTIPLFPLRTVLFPGGLLPLKVFEQRYVEMTKRCMKEELPFGVVMITSGEEVATQADAPAFANFGTLARITAWDMPQLGILHVATEGLTRFQVREHRVQPDRLVVADVVDIPTEPRLPLPADAEPLAKILRQHHLAAFIHGDQCLEPARALFIRHAVPSLDPGDNKYSGRSENSDNWVADTPALRKTAQGSI